MSRRSRASRAGPPSAGASRRPRKRRRACPTARTRATWRSTAQTSGRRCSPSPAPSPSRATRHPCPASQTATSTTGRSSSRPPSRSPRAPKTTAAPQAEKAGQRARTAGRRRRRRRSRPRRPNGSGSTSPPLLPQIIIAQQAYDRDASANELHIVLSDELTQNIAEMLKKSVLHWDGDGAFTNEKGRAGAKGGAGLICSTRCYCCCSGGGAWKFRDLDPSQNLFH